MKKLIIAAALIAVIVTAGLLTGCERVPIWEREGNEVTRDFTFTGFTGIEIGDAFDLEVTYADTYRVTITAGENLMDRLDVSKTGDILEIDLENWWFWWHSTPKAVITMPVLNSLDISGATEADVRGFRSNEDLSLTLSGASQLDIDMETGDFDADISGASNLIGYLKAIDTDIQLSGASEVRLTGSGENLFIDGSGASTVNLTDFPVGDADIELSGACHGKADISGRLDVSLSGASSLEYSGNPTLGRVDVSGASSLEEKRED